MNQRSVQEYVPGVEAFPSASLILLRPSSREETNLSKEPPSVSHNINVCIQNRLTVIYIATHCYPHSHKSLNLPTPKQHIPSNFPLHLFSSKTPMPPPLPPLHHHVVGPPPPPPPPPRVQAEVQALQSRGNKNI
jgi:hypothetical protein